MKKSMMFAIKFVAILIVVLTVCTTTAGCGTTEDEASPKNLPERFVVVAESKICSDYQLGIDGCQEDNEMVYIVDRYSRLVYIYTFNGGSYDSGISMMPCPDKEGHHMKYEGELPE